MSKLTQEIVKHIFSKLGVGNDLYVMYSSIMDPNFLLEKTICLVNNEDEEVNNSMWSCKLSVENKEFRLLLADLSTLGEKEYGLIVSLQDSPEYGCYFSITDPDSSFIGTLVNGFWIQSNVYIQSSFLTGMEQISDLAVPWKPNDNIDDLYEKLVEFTKYHDERFSNEG